MESTLIRIIERSSALEDALLLHLENVGHDGSDRSRLTETMCGIAMEHAFSQRLLISTGCFTSGIALLRLQYEAVTRATWLYFAATDGWIVKLSAPLTPGEKKAGDSPSMSEMLTQIEKKAPPGPSQLLEEFKTVHWKSINSYVHGGIHPVKRSSEGYPYQLLIQLLQNANGLSTMSAMLIAMMSGDGRITKGMKSIQLDFMDCLPPLKPIVPSTL
jgi:hypothetical protein